MIISLWPSLIIIGTLDHNFVTNTFHLCQIWNVVQHHLNCAALNRMMSDRDDNVEALSCMTVTVGRDRPNTGRSVFDRSDRGLDEEETKWSR